MLPDGNSYIIKKVLFSTLLLIIACNGKEPSPPKTAPVQPPEIKIVLTVNSEPITKDEFSWRFQAVTGYSLEDSPVRKDELPAVKKAFLEKLILKKVLLQEAAHLGYSLEENEFKEGVQELLKDYPKESMKENIEEFKKDPHRNILMRENLLVRKLIDRETNRKVLIKKSELFRYYKKHPGKFVRPEKVHVWQILSSSEEEANRIRGLFKKGKINFKKLAVKRAGEENGFMNGDLGFIQKGQISDIFDKVAFSLKRGRISPVFKTEFGYHIIRVTKKAKPEEIGFYEAKPIILKKLMEERADQAYRKWIKELKERSTIKINVNFF